MGRWLLMLVGAYRTSKKAHYDLTEIAEDAFIGTYVALAPRLAGSAACVGAAVVEDFAQDLSSYSRAMKIDSLGDAVLLEFIAGRLPFEEGAEEMAVAIIRELRQTLGEGSNLLLIEGGVVLVYEGSFFIFAV